MGDHDMRIGTGDIYWENIAALGYKAYREHRDTLDRCNDQIAHRDLPRWENLTHVERVAWVAATLEIVRVHAIAVLGP